MTYTYELVCYYTDKTSEVLTSSHSIKEIDNYTTQYLTKEELCQKNHCIDMKIRYKDHQNKIKYTQILLKKDIFIYESVINCYATYLTNNTQALLNLLNKISPVVRNHQNPKNKYDENCLLIYHKINKNIKDYDYVLISILNSYFGKGKPIYSKYRTVYLGLLEKGIKAKCLKIDPPPKIETKVIIGYYSNIPKVNELIKQSNLKTFKDLTIYLQSNPSLTPKEKVSIRPIYENNKEDIDGIYLDKPYILKKEVW